MIHLRIIPEQWGKHEGKQPACRRKVVSYLCLFLVWTGYFVGCTPPGGNRDIPQIQMTIRNTLPIKREHVPIVLSLAELKQIAPDFSLDAYLVVSGEPPIEIHSQADDMNYDSQRDELVFLVDLEPQETKNISIRYSPDSQMAVTLEFTRRTRAGIFPELDGFAALESELIAYLFHPNGSIRAHGKRTQGLFIDQWVHQDAAPSDSSEDMMTPLTTADGLIGEGGFVLWDTANQKPIPLDRAKDYVRILADGPVRSVVQRIIPDLQLRSDRSISLTSTFSIYGGHRWGQHRIKVQGLDGPYRIAIGVPNRRIDPDRNEKEGWLAVWDERADASPSGFGMIYPVDGFDAFQDVLTLDSGESSLVWMNPDENGEVFYRFVSVWGEGENGIQTREAFKQFMRVTATEIRTPPVIEFLQQQPEKQQEPEKSGNDEEQVQEG
ncbi:MAG: DUF4861 family protein [Candidatus Poribacteria bacterium]|nr:DUF4861 family protein [Candidatus Poribacteria bacterium]